jgi:hypothetical protein
MKAGMRMGSLVLGGFLSLVRVGPAAADEVWVPLTHLAPPSFNPFPWPTSGAGFASFAFAVPDKFASLTSVKVALIPKSSLGGAFDIYGSIKRDGEAAGGGLLSNFAIPATLAAGTVQEIDVTALLAGQLEADSAGHDYVSVFFWFPASPGRENATVLGLRFTYQAVLVQTADIANGAITTPKLANDSVTNAKIADNSVGTDKVLNNSLASEDILNGTIGAVDINKSEVQARVAESCPSGQSIRSISSAGDVVCEADTAGLTSYVREVDDETCIANQYCYHTITCAGGRFAMGGGIYYGGGYAYNVSFFQSYPVGDHTWNVGLYNGNDDPVDIQVYVTCATGTTGASLSAAPAAAARQPRAHGPVRARW